MKFDKNKLLTTVSAVALVLAVGACSSSGDDDGLTAERDTALEGLKAAAAARDAAQARVTELEGQLETANGMVTDLQGQLDMANTDLGTANGMVMSIQGMLDTANADVTRLMGELDTANGNTGAAQVQLDMANGDVTRLMGELDTANGNTDAVQVQLDMANGDVTRLMGELDTANGNTDAVQVQLDMANGDVTRLMGELDTASGNTDAVQVQLDMANGDVTRLMGELDTANGNTDAVQVQLDMANGDVTRLMGELDTANGNTDAVQVQLDMANGDVTRLTSELDTANGNTDAVQVQLDMANGDVTRLTSELAMANKRADDAEADVTRLEGELKTAKDRIAEIEKKAADDRADDIAEDASDKAAEVLEALAMPSGVLPTITVSASSGGTFAAKATGYTESSTAADAISGFRGKILTKDGAEAHVYTDIENAVAVPIGGIYDSTADFGEPDEYGVFETETVDAGENAHNIPWSVVKRTDDKSTTTGDGDTAKTTFAGSVRGLAGTFSCTGMPCTPPVPVAADDDAVSSTEMWAFVPTVTEGTIDIADGAPESKDDGYVHFGWWLNMQGDDVDDGFDVQAFAGATGYDGFEGGNSTTVTGSATYTGGAAGKWAIASTTEDRTEGGHFTATATLGVDFDANTAAPGDDANKNGVTVSGSITDFMTGATSRPSWKVTLTYDGNDGVEGVQPSMMLPTTFTDADAGTEAKTKWTTGGAVDGMGTWEATFHGSEKDTGHPMAVVGTFNAAIGGGAIGDGAIGRIQGAYGATK